MKPKDPVRQKLRFFDKYFNSLKYGPRRKSDVKFPCRSHFHGRDQQDGTKQIRNATDAVERFQIAPRFRGELEGLGNTGRFLRIGQ